MDTFYQFLGLAGAVLIIFILYRRIKGNPEQFTKANLSKSVFTMGILAVGLIAFVALLVFMVRNT